VIDFEKLGKLYLGRHFEPWIDPAEAERMFFVSTLLNRVVSWVRTQSGTSSLRAILYMDEVFGFLPPVAEPPSKRPLLTLLKLAWKRD